MPYRIKDIHMCYYFREIEKSNPLAVRSYSPFPLSQLLIPNPQFLVPT